jgi:DNA invertase Pin-like site-specific DNA recombinase
VKTAIYCRISEDKQNGAGVERQLGECQALASRKGWQLMPTPFIDNDISASKYTRKQRPAYRALLAAIRSGEVNRVLTWAVDRLYRQPKELEELIDLADAGRVEVATVTGGDVDLNTSDGRLVMRMLVSVAAKSSEDTSKRLKSQKQQARQKGHPTGGPRPFGWGKDQRTPDKTESRLLLDAMDAVLAGASLNDIARGWGAAGVRGRLWNTSDVRHALTMPRHAGLVVHQGAVVGKGTWKPLVPRERWERVCAVLEGRSGSSVPRRRSLLTGLVICGRCGATMSRSTSARGAARIWRCDRGPSRPGCGRVAVMAAPLEAVVVRAVMKYVDGADLAALVHGDDDRVDYAALARRLEDVERREDEVAASFSKKRITMRQLERINRDLEAEKKDLRSRLAQLASQTTLEPYAGRAGALQAVWDQLSEDQRRTIIAESIGKVTIAPATVVGRKFDPSRILLGRAAATSAPSPAA